MMETRKIIKLLLLVCMPLLAGAQDIHFSQFAMAPLGINPSATGAEPMRVLVNYKNQWGSVSMPYKTYNVSFDLQLKKKKDDGGFWAAGIDVFSDKAGDGQMGTTQGLISGAYHLPLNDHHTLRGGAIGGLGQRSISYSALQWSNQYDGSQYNAAMASGETGGSAFLFLDLGAGMSWSYKKKEAYISGHDRLEADAGFAVYHVNRPAYSFSGSGERLYMKMVAHGSTLLEIKNTNYAFVPGFMFFRQGPARELLLGSMIRYTLQESSRYTGLLKENALSLGVYYRNKDAFITTMLLEMNRYALGVSYDFNVSKLRAASDGRGGFEISLRVLNASPFIRSSHARF